MHGDKYMDKIFITLILKNDHTQGLGEYRLIYLIGSVYKILAKVLASRLKKVLPNVISKCQSAFLRERHILDGVVVVNEVVDLVKRWINWMKACIFSSSLLVSVNGSPIKDFR